MLKTKKGFTLIELLIVIVIIGILAVIVVGLVATNSRNRANDARKKSDLREIQTALEQYKIDNNAYPTPAEYGTNILVTNNYLAAMPTSPDTNAYTYESPNPAANPACTDCYRLYVVLGNQNDSGPGTVTINGSKAYAVSSKQ